MRPGNFITKCLSFVTDAFRRCTMKKAKKVFKQNVALPITIVGNFGPSMGNTALNLIQAAAYLTNEDEDSISSNGIALGFIVCMMLIDLRLNWFSRLPSYKKKFGSQNENQNEDKVAEKKSVNSTRKCQCESCNVCLANSVFGVTASFGVASGVFTALATYLGTLFLIEYVQLLAGMTKQDLHEQSHIALGFIYFAGTLFAMAKLAGFLIYNFEKILERAAQVYAVIARLPDQEGQAPLHKGALAITLMVTFFNLVGDIGQSYLSTGKGLARLPFGLSPRTIEITTYFSLFSRFISYLHTQPFALYDAIEKSFRSEQTPVEEKMIAYEYRKTLKEITFLGILASVGVGLANMPGIAKLLHNINNNIDPQNIWIKGGTVSSAVTSAITNYAFMGAEPKQDFIKRKVKEQKESQPTGVEMPETPAQRNARLAKLLAATDEGSENCFTYQPPPLLQIDVINTQPSKENQPWEKAKPTENTSPVRFFTRSTTPPPVLHLPRSSSLNDIERLREPLLEETSSPSSRLVQSAIIIREPAVRRQ